MKTRRIAIITGWSLILMAIIAGFSFGYALSEFYQPHKSSFIKSNIQNNTPLYLYMLIGMFLILILDVIVTYTLYEFFKNCDRKISLLSGVLRMVYTLIFGLAIFYLTKNLNISELTNEGVNANFHSFESLWSGGLILFGFHILLIGILMKLHNKIPKILWYLTLIAGISYTIVNALKFIELNLVFLSKLEIVLAIPMALGELGLAVWLLLKGGNHSKI